MSYLDNDELHKPNTGGTIVYTLEVPSPVSKEQLTLRYPDVFNKGVRQLEGEYHI